MRYAPDNLRTLLPFFRKNPRRRQGFTLVEVLLSIAILSALYLIVGKAVDIPAVLLGTHDAKRKHDVREIEQSLYQQIVDAWALSVDIPEGAENAKDICRQGIFDPTCVNLDSLVTGGFLPSLPLDAKETNAHYTGYRVYKVSGRPRILSAHLGAL